MIIVLSGKARSGKDTVANILKNLFIQEQKSVRTIAYADFLKHILSQCFLLSPEQLYGDLKEAPIEGLLLRGGSLLESNRYWTPRELLQYIGTDVFRSIDPNCWINAVKSKVLYSSDAAHSIITDGRFSNEIDWVLEETDGYHIHITRDTNIFVNNATHASETSLNDFERHERRFFINNNDSMFVLEDNIKSIWRYINGK